MEFFNPLALRAEGENHRIPPRATFSQPHTLAQLAGSPILLRNTEEQMVAFSAPALLPPLTITLQFLVHIGPKYTRFCLKFHKNAIRLLNLTKFSNRGGNLEFLYINLQTYIVAIVNLCLH